MKPSTIVDPEMNIPLTAAELASFKRTQADLEARYGCQLVFDPELLIQEEPSIAAYIKEHKLTPYQIRNIALRGGHTPKERTILTTAMVAGMRRDAYRTREMNT